MNFLQIPKSIHSVSSETIFNVAGFKINNSTLFIVLIVFLVAAFCFFAVRRFRLIPGKTQAVTEIIYEGIENFLVSLTGNKKEAGLLLPFIGALFIFIAISNLFGMLPGLESFTWEGIQIFRTPTSDFNTTFSLALSALLIIQLMSILDFGFWGYLGRFFKFKEIYYGFKEGISAGFISIIEFFIGLLEAISEFTKVISLSLRLFGNVYAGITLTSVIFGIFSYFLPSILMASEMLFAVIQTIVFGSLVTVYYILATKSKVSDL